MFSNVRLWRKNGEHWTGCKNCADLKTQESSENSSSFSTVHGKEAEPVIIDSGEDIGSVAIFADGKHVVSSHDQGTIRRWRTEDGKEVGTAMNVGSGVLNIAVSRDGKLIVGGTVGGLVTVWNAESLKSDRVQNTPRLRACSRHLARRDEDRDWIGG